LQPIQIRLETEGAKPGQSTHSWMTMPPASNAVLYKPLHPVLLDEHGVYYSNSPMQRRNFEVFSPRTSGKSQDIEGTEI